MLAGDDNRVIVAVYCLMGIALALIRHWFLIQNWSHNTGPSRAGERSSHASSGESFRITALCRNLNQDVGNVAKLAEGYDVGIDANTAHASSSRWKCMRPGAFSIQDCVAWVLMLPFRVEKSTLR